MANIILKIVQNSVFQFIGVLCSIVGVLIGILALIPSTRNKLFHRRKVVKIGEQNIEGSGNIQAGGDISSQNKINLNGSYSEYTVVRKQSIKGNNNKQAGGGIDG
jgi:hypothetical protein